MSPFPLETLFSLAGGFAATAWLLLVLVPLRYRAPRWVAVAVAALISTLYAGLIGAFWTQGEGGFGSLAEVARLFDHRGLLLAGWVHYLAFDLLVGVWERDEAHRVGVSQWVLAPCLALTFLLGPLGWLAFMVVRAMHGRAESTPLPATH